jgi:hypothetical protein
MILDQATALVRDATAVRERELLSRQRASWQTHTDRFAAIRERLASAAQFLAWCSAAGGADQPPRDAGDLAAAIGSVAKLHEALLADPGAVLEGNQVPDVASQVEALAKRLEEEARSTWANHLDQDEWVPASLWTPFENSSTYGASVRDAMHQDRRRKDFARLPFPTEAQQGEYEQLMQDRAALLARLPDTSDEEISAFLVAAAGPGVPLAQYSEAVAAWLVEHGLADRYVIRTRG